MATQVESEVARRRFTAEEFMRMDEAGFFAEDDRLELIDGEIVEMQPIGTPHHRCVMLLTSLVIRQLGEDWLVGVQGPVQAGALGLPQPDLAVVRADAVQESHADASETVLIIEVADISLRYDRNVKLPLYARSGYPEAWIVDLPGALVDRHTEPAGGEFRRVDRFGRGDTVKSQALPGLSIAVDDILP